MSNKVTIDESQILEALERIIKKFGDSEDQSDRFVKSLTKNMKEAGKSATGADAAIEKMADKIVDAAKETDKLTKKNTDLKGALKSAADQTTIFGVNIGQTSDKLESMIGNIGGVTKGLAGNVKGLKAVKLALISTGIGAFLVILGSLVTFLTKTQKGMDKVAVAGAKLGSVVSNVIDRIAQVGEGISDFFSGNRAEGIDKIKNSFKGLGDEIRRDAEAAELLAKRSIALREAQRELNKEFAAARAEIKEYNLIAEDTSKSFAEREAAAKSAFELEQKFFKENQRLANEDLAIIKEKNSLSNSLVEDLDAEADAQIRVSQLAEESLGLQTTINSKLNSIRKEAASAAKQAAAEAAKALAEEQKRVEELTAAYTDLIDGVDERIAQAELQKLEGADRLRAERDFALEEIDLLEKTAKAAADAAGVKFAAEEKFLKLRQQIQEDFAKSINEGRGGVVSPLNELEKQLTEFDPSEVAISTTEAVTQAFDKSIKSSNPFERFKESLKDALSIDDQQLDSLVDGLQQSFSIIKDSILSNLDSQLEANDKLLDSIRDQTDTVEDEIDKQQELKDAGYANDLSLNQARLSDLQSQEKKALEEQKKIQKAKSAIETVEQIGSLISASANIFKAFSAIPFVGVPLAIAAIGAMFGTFAASKVQAARAARAYKGGPVADAVIGQRSSGFVQRGGPSDIPGRGDGIPVGDGSLVLGGDEFIVREGPARDHAAFLHQMNKGAFSKARIAEFMSGTPNLKAKVVSFQKRENSINDYERSQANSLRYNAIYNATKAATSEQTHAMISYLKGRKRIAPISPDGRIEYNDDVTEVIKAV